MFNSAIIEVAIGIIFVFSLLSILVTQINNIMIRVLNLKAARLKAQLDDMLRDPVIRAKILTHPLIRMVDVEISEVLMAEDETRLTQEMARRLAEKEKARVEYIDTNIFVDVLLDVLTENTGQKLYEALENVIDKMEPSTQKSMFRQILRQIQLSGTGLDDLRNLIDQLNDPETQRQMLAALNLVDAALDKLRAENSDLIPLLLGIRQIKDQYLETALMAVLNTASNLQDARRKLGEWFNGSMDRATQIYFRQMQRISLLVSLLLALLLNVDALFLARVLWDDPALRTSVAVTAAATAPQLGSTMTQPDTEAGDGSVADLERAFLEARGTLESLLELRLPIGWVVLPLDAEDLQSNTVRTDRLDGRNLWQFWPPNNPGGFLSLWILKIIGICLTTLALAQGAPFWFDLLRKLTRSS
jgi:hypothetical protein